jgi:peptidoglycan/xylan/chitin deacetylase (PgdA/CDA1 family)
MMTLPRGIFTISIDFELIWGTLDLFGPSRFRRACETERLLVGRLLSLFEEFEIPATWCILGHLFLDKCASGANGKHPEIIRPRHSWCSGDWFDHDPGATEAAAPLFYGKSLVEKIVACKVPQDIGCHTFSHVIFGDAGCSRETAESEVRACVRLAKELGITMRSFAFPRNSVGHLAVLRQLGFTCYRGPEPVWHEKTGIPAFVKRCGRLWEVLTIASPPTVLPEYTGSELWNIPGSMIYFPMNGFRSAIPLFWRTRRAFKGLDAAARRQRIFHLWFHPTNLSDRPDAMFRGLEQILEKATLMRRKGDLEIRTLAEVASLQGLAPNSLTAVG